MWLLRLNFLQPESKRAFRRFFTYFKEYKKSVLLGISVVPVSIVVSLIMPMMTIKIVDDYIAKGRSDGIYIVIAAYAVVFLTGYLADNIYYYKLQKSGTMVLGKARAGLFAHILKLPRSYFEKTPNGITLARLTTDFETIGETLAMGVVSLIVELLKALVLCCLLVYISLRLSIVFALVVPVLLVVTQLIRRRLRFYYDSARAALAESISFLSECLQGIKAVLLLNATASMEAKYDKKNQAFLRSQKATNFYEALLFSLVEGIGLISVAIILWVGSQHVAAGVLSIGTLIAFYQTMQKIFLPIRELTQQISTIQRATASLVSVDNLFRVPQDVFKPNIGKTGDKFQFLEFRDVSFRYLENKPLVLKNVSFRLDYKERIAFVGRTGSGKSTILKLIAKQYQGYEGEIIINGHELSTLSKQEVLDMFSIMTQDVFLFNESVYFNVALSYDQEKASAVQNAINYVQADIFINDFAEGLDYEVLENGKNLSLGQSQMIGLARAYARDKEVFILDEATAAIDSVTEYYIEQALQKILKEKTVIAVAHRLSTVKNADQIIVLDHGKIIEQGSHQKLVDLKGHYFHLLQAGKQKSLSEIESQNNFTDD